MSSGLSLVLVRHGETEWMERGRLHGRLDSPLSAAGRLHAEQAAERLRGEPFDALYSSPLGRAMETAAILGRAVGLEPQPIEGLTEFAFGWMEGAPAPLWRDSSWVGTAFRPFRAFVHLLSGEPPRAFAERVAQALHAITTRHADGRLLVVGHWAVFSALLAAMLNEPATHWRRFGPWTPCGISEVRRITAGARSPRWEIVRLNDISHLQEALAA